MAETDEEGLGKSWADEFSPVFMLGWNPLADCAPDNREALGKLLAQYRARAEAVIGAAMNGRVDNAAEVGLKVIMAAREMLMLKTLAEEIGRTTILQAGSRC